MKTYIVANDNVPQSLARTSIGPRGNLLASLHLVILASIN